MVELNSVKKTIFAIFLLFSFSMLFAAEGSEDSTSNTDSKKTETATNFENSIDETKIKIGEKTNPQKNETNDLETTRNKEDSTLDLAVKGNQSSSSTRLIQLIGSLVIVCILAYIVIKFLKKSTKVFGVDDPYLKTVASMNLSQNKSVHIITVGEKAYLIGVTDSSINPIAEIDDKNLIDAMNLEAERKMDRPKTDFQSVLAQFFPKIRQEEKTIGKDFFELQRNRLNQASQENNEDESE